MKNIFTKRSLIDLLYWIAFGIASFAAGARFSVNPIAFIGMFAIVFAMLMREWNCGLRAGSDIASKIWREGMDRMFEQARNEK